MFNCSWTHYNSLNEVTFLGYWFSGFVSKFLPECSPQHFNQFNQCHSSMACECCTIPARHKNTIMYSMARNLEERCAKLTRIFQYIHIYMYLQKNFHIGVHAWSHIPFLYMCCRDSCCYGVYSLAICTLFSCTVCWSSFTPSSAWNTSLSILSAICVF